MTTTSQFITAEIEEKVQDFINDLETTHTNLGEYIDIEDIDLDSPFDSITTMVEDNLDVDIIFYSRAMEYLTENDTSLQESLEIAEEYGYSPGNLNSEVLASLLASKENRQEFWEMEDKINNFFEEIQEEIEELDEEE